MFPWPGLVLPLCSPQFSSNCSVQRSLTDPDNKHLCWCLFKYPLLLVANIFTLWVFHYWWRAKPDKSHHGKSRVRSPGRSRGHRWSPKVRQSAACAHALRLCARGAREEPRKASLSAPSIMDPVLSSLLLRWRERQPCVRNGRFAPVACLRPRRADLHLLSWFCTEVCHFHAFSVRGFLLLFSEFSAPKLQILAAWTFPSVLKFPSLRFKIAKPRKIQLMIGGCRSFTGVWVGFGRCWH